LRSRQLAPAKLNLELRVLERLPDGFHRVETLLQAISLSDELTIEPAAQSSIEVSGFEAPSDEGNLALRAAAALEQPVHVRLLKRIPSGAGFGGGSSDAAAVLRAIGSDRDDLDRLAAELGADVSFFLRGGRALAVGRGERLRQLPDPDDDTWYALAWPGFEVSTAAVYRRWDEVGGEGRNHLRRAAEAIEPRLVEFAAELGEGWVMTGSGSAFFKEAPTRAAAEEAAASLSCWTAVAQAEPRLTG
jgi:4-diphosphocytidyl-2-C-methyl-D-erythritol kinase